MKPVRPGISIAAAAFGTLSLCAVAAGADFHGIPNFAQVEPGIWRGGQPTAQGWAYLKSLGVKRAIKLNTENEASDDAARTNGIQVLAFPITLAQQTVGKPKLEAISGAVNSISTNGTYIHCEHGQDRTGLIVGTYRVKVEHWTKNNAYQEMTAHGFHPLLRGLHTFWQEDIRDEFSQQPPNGKTNYLK